ncbi:MAG: universal stress protein [Alphaproteobacteria bacterium]|nr:universal stress protein [Alphaproteobacteria bacterium]
MYSDILLAVDLNQESSWTRALPVAVGHCEAFAARLHLLTVVPDFGMPIVGGFFPEDFAKKALADARARLDAFARDKVPAGVACNAIVRQGTVYEVILAVAQAVGADLIVTASHRPEHKDYLLGPNAARVVRHAEVSVLVVR